MEDGQQMGVLSASDHSILPAKEQCHDRECHIPDLDLSDTTMGRYLIRILPNFANSSALHNLVHFASPLHLLRYARPKFVMSFGCTTNLRRLRVGIDDNTAQAI